MPLIGRKIVEDDLGDEYVDIDSIKKRNGFVYLWALMDFIEPYQGREFSQVSKYKVDCKDIRKRQRYLPGNIVLLSFTTHSKQMGKGTD